MNGYDVYDRAIIRLGFKATGKNEIMDAGIMGRAVEFINQIATDLKLKQIEALSDNIDCSAELGEALCCGVAMLISLCEGDANKNVIFTALYNAKRTTVLSSKAYIEDTLPIAEG